MTARHAATDGSFGRSAGGAAARGAGLLLIAVVLGILLLNAGGGDPYARIRAGAEAAPPVTVPIPTATTFTVPLRPPAEIKVVPANGTGTAGAGTNTGNKLKAAGYNILAATNTAKPAAASNIFFIAGYEREARVVAQLLGLPDSSAQLMPNPPPVADVRDANLVVVVGPDLARSAPPVTSSPSTTVHRATATTARPTATTVRRATATTVKAATTTSKP